MIPPETNVARSDRAVYRELAEGEGGVLLHLDSAAYHGVNAVGAHVWAALDGGTFGDLLGRLRADFTSLPSTFDEEISGYLTDLAARGLVVLGGNPGDDGG